METTLKQNKKNTQIYGVTLHSVLFCSVLLHKSNPKVLLLLLK